MAHFPPYSSKFSYLTLSASSPAWVGGNRPSVPMQLQGARMWHWETVSREENWGKGRKQDWAGETLAAMKQSQEDLHRPREL